MKKPMTKHICDVCEIEEIVEMELGPVDMYSILLSKIGGKRRLDMDLCARCAAQVREYIQSMKDEAGK